MAKKRRGTKKKVARRRTARAARPAPAKKRKPAAKIHLTPREEEIFRLLSLGCTVREAAASLDVAPSTADNHKARLMAKLGVDKAAILTRRAIQMGVTNMKDKLDAREKRRSGRRGDGWN
jgi:DNA-binding NarL/FixJ family response regulator